MASDDGLRWNHNIHFHRVVLAAIPGGARSALDVGTGNGMLTAEMRGRVAEVVAIDTDAHVLNLAAVEHSGIQWVHDDVMTTTSDAHSTSWRLLLLSTTSLTWTRHYVVFPS